jgi:rhomboid protease GluP
MFSRILKIYLILFISFFIGYSYVHYFFVKEISSLGLDNFYVSYLIPIVIVSILTFILYRPITKQLPLNTEKIWVLFWIIIPNSIAIPIGISQEYFTKLSYNLIEIATPDEVMLYPNEKFFTIQKYHINRDEFSAFQEQSHGLSRGKNFYVSNYYIVPLYSDTVNNKFNITCGIYYSTKINDGILFADGVAKEIENFNISSANNILGYNFSDIKFFERLLDKDQMLNFQSAWMFNTSRNQMNNPIVLIPQQEEFSDFLSDKRDVAVISTLVSLIITILFLSYLRVKYDL